MDWIDIKQQQPIKNGFYWATLENHINPSDAVYTTALVKYTYPDFYIKNEKNKYVICDNVVAWIMLPKAYTGRITG